MKVKTNELDGAALDWAVGSVATCIPPTEFLRMVLQREYKPTRSWVDCGPIIERYGISLNPPVFTGGDWVANINPGSFKDFKMRFAPTPLIAVCRVLVAANTGDEVDIPRDFD